MTNWLLPLIGVIGSWIAVQQMLIARKKLNHDLFDKRFSVFMAAQEYMVACLNRGGGTREDMRNFYGATQPAPFLFDREINNFLKELMDKSVTLQVFHQYRGQPDIPEYQEFMQRYHSAQLWIAGEAEKLTDRFYKQMNLSNLTPFSMTEIVSVPDPQNLMDKLSARLHGKKE